jgi:hydroxyacylglutathione hydrolase
MEILFHPFSELMTNCYIIKEKGVEIIIDPGIGATQWVLENVRNPVAILNTHGHYDHVWSNSELKKTLKIPLVCPKEDHFLVSLDQFGSGLPPSYPDVEVEGDDTLTFGGIAITYIHLPGHTPGCSVIVINNVMFSGDFVFKGTIGRFDFPYSDALKMRQSIAKFLTLKTEMTIYPGHGPKTSVKTEQNNLKHYEQ